MRYVDVKKQNIKGVSSISSLAGVSSGVNGIQNSRINTEDNAKKSGIWKFILVGVVLLLGLAVFLKWDAIKSMFNPITIAASINKSNLKSTDGRTNILILGSDKRTKSDIGSGLTDTILVASIGKVDNDIVMISLPRDLWVKTPSGYESKINAVYASDAEKGSDNLISAVQDVLGMEIHYYGIVNFKLFEEVIDTMGGVDVDVERAFDDYYYPVEGMENAPMEQRYEHLHFEAGKQNMNGATALKYVRSRKGDNEEGTDFARAKRQQKVIMAIKDKALSIQTILNPQKIAGLYDAYATEVDHNFTLSDLQNFYLLSQEINFAGIRNIVLDDRSAADVGGLLYAPEDSTLYNGQYVLIPRSGDYTQIHAYVQRYLYADK